MVGFLGWIERPEVFWFGSLFLLNRISLKDSLWRRRDTWTKNRSSLDNRTIVNDEYGSQYQIEGWYLFELHGRHQEIKHYVNEVTVWCYFRKSGRSFSKIYNWVVVSNVFYFHPLSGKDSHFDEHIFQLGWFNHQPENLSIFSWYFEVKLLNEFSLFLMAIKLPTTSVPMAAWSLMEKITCPTCPTSLLTPAPPKKLTWHWKTNHL